MSGRCRHNEKQASGTKRAGRGSSSSGTVLLAVRDLVKAFLIGLAAAVIVAALAFLIGTLAGGGTAAGLETAKNVLFALCAVLLFILAGMLLIKGKKPEKKPEGNGWRRHFSVIGPKLLFGMLAIAFIICASVLDYIQLKI